MEDEEEQEWEEDEQEPKKMKSEKKEKSKIMPILIVGIIIGVIIVALLFLLGLGSGVDSITVTANPLDEKDAIEIVVVTHTSGILGASPSGNVDFVIEYTNGSVTAYQGEVKLSGGGGNLELPVNKFYIDNGEYLVSVTYEGKSDEYIVNIEKTVKAVVVEAYEEKDKDGLEVTFAFGKSKHKMKIGEGENAIEREVIDSYKDIKEPVGNGTIIIKYNNSDSEEKREVYRTNFSIMSRKIIWEYNEKTEDIPPTYYKLLIKYDDFYQEKGTYTAYVEFTNSIGADKETYSGEDIDADYIDRD